MMARQFSVGNHIWISHCRVSLQSRGRNRWITLPHCLQKETQRLSEICVSPVRWDKWHAGCLYSSLGKWNQKVEAEVVSRIRICFNEKKQRCPSMVLDAAVISRSYILEDGNKWRAETSPLAQVLSTSTNSPKIIFLTPRHLMTVLVACFFTSEEVALGITLSRGVGAHFQCKSGICILRLEDTWIFRNMLLLKSTWVKGKQKVSLFSFLDRMCSTSKWDADEFLVVKGIPSAG